MSPSASRMALSRDTDASMAAASDAGGDRAGNGAGAAPGPSSGGVEVVKVEPRHMEILAEFFRQAWSPATTGESVRRARANEAAANPAAHGEEPATFLLLRGGEAIGYIGTIPIRVWDGDAERPAAWLKGLMVLPAHRNGPVGFLVLKSAVQDVAERLGCGMAMVVQPAPRRLFGALKYDDLGAVPNYLRVLRPTAVLRRLDLEALGLSRLPAGIPAVLRLGQSPGIAHVAGAAAAAALGLYTRLAGGWRRGLRIGIGAVPDATAADLDTLWRRVRSQLRAAVVRDAAYLAWRYRTTEDPRRSGDGGAVSLDGERLYRPVTVRDRAGLQGFAVVRRPSASGDPRLKGIRVATLSDLLFPPDRADVGLSLLDGAERAARSIGADALLCSVSHRSMPPLLRRRGFVRLPGNVHFMLRDDTAGNAQRDAAGPRSVSLADWWVTRGDSAADDVF